MKSCEQEYLEWTLELVTPGFLGGSDNSRPQALPAASIKGALRFWYRAIVPDATIRGSEGFEARIFGTNYGQSMFLLRAKVENDQQDKINAKELREKFIAFNQGRGLHTRNGATYLGYSLFLGENKRRMGWAPGTRIHCRAIFPRGMNDQDRKGLLAAIWALGHLGGIGSRSRRGFGSVQLAEWRSNRKSWEKLMEQLPLLDEAGNMGAWHEQIARVQKRFIEWFGNWHRKRDYPHLGPETAYWLGLPGERDWAKALEQAGRRMQEFRVRREPDYSLVKEALMEGKRAPARVPQRCAFGLPLTFRFSSLKKKGTMTFEAQVSAGDETRIFHRWPSPLLVRLVKIGNALYPFMLRFDGPVPGQGRLAKVGVKNWRRSVPQADENLLEIFMDSLEGVRPWNG